MIKQLKPNIITMIMDKAIQLSNIHKEESRDFRIMVSPMRKNSLILRWTSIDMSDLDRPLQCYHYECFHTDGSSQNCSINYTNQEEANTFFFSLQTLYKQEFSIDHKS